MYFGFSCRLRNFTSLTMPMTSIVVLGLVVARRGSDGRWGLPGGNKVLRHAFADDCDALRGGGVLRTEGAAGEKRNLHGFEVAVADDVVMDTDVLVVSGMPATRTASFQLPSLKVNAEKLAALTPGKALTRASIC